jgi:hypothetical protein
MGGAGLLSTDPHPASPPCHYQGSQRAEVYCLPSLRRGTPLDGFSVAVLPLLQRVDGEASREPQSRTPCD